MEPANLEFSDGFPATQLPSPAVDEVGTQETSSHLINVEEDVSDEVQSDGIVDEVQELITDVGEEDEDSLVQEQSVSPPVLPQFPQRWRRSRMYRPLVLPPSRTRCCPLIGENTVSCIVLAILLWIFACMSLTLGLYGTGSIFIGQGCSLLLQPNRLFVESINVEPSSGTNAGPILYGFYSKPPLDVISTWSEMHSGSLPADSHKDWVYFLNEGSQINISYSIPSSSQLLLSISRGRDGYKKWLSNPLSQNDSLSWNIIRGNGLIEQSVSNSGNYYIGIGNLNSEVVEVWLNISARAYLYNTTGAYYMCKWAQGQCSVPLLFLEENSAVLTTPHLRQGTPEGEWHVRLTFGPRWTVYFGGAGLITVFLLVAIYYYNKYGCICLHMAWQDSSGAPLLPYKDEDLLSWGSSYDSVSEDGSCPEDALVSRDGKDGESSRNPQRHCAICLDASRDCFFIPCGHSVACFTCGTRIAESDGTCPICRRRMKKVKRIYVSRRTEIILDRLMSNW